MTTLGKRLQEAREEKRLTLEKAFEATRIRVQYLQALEADDLSVMPSPVQARGYLRNYAEFLGLNVDKVLADLRETNAQKPSEEVIGPADVVDAQTSDMTEPPQSSEVAPITDTAPLIKPKPTRRRKADSQPGADSVTTPKRRPRKKVDAEPDLIVPSESVTDNIPSEVPSSDINHYEESAVPTIENLKLEEPTDSGTVDAAQIGEIATVELAPEETSPSTVEEIQPVSAEPSSPIEIPPADVNDNLWQSWLGRLTSVLAARNKRPTLVPNEPVIAEMESNSTLAETELQQEQVNDANLPAEDSTQIFKEIGIELRKRRELLSLHLDEVERNTHVKAHYLDALERGAMEELPSTVQTRGMLSNYATFLDLDVDVLLLRFADALQARHRERNPQKPMRKPGQPIIANLPPVRSFIAGDLVFGVGIVVLLVGFAIWGVSRVMELQGQQQVQPTAPSISQILLTAENPSSVTATPTFIEVDTFPGQPSATIVIPTLNADVNVQVNLVAVERTYMRVIVDGKVVFEGRVVPGTAYPFEAVDQIEVLVGSGAAIRIVYNGRDMGLLGSFGQVVSNIYLADDIVTPTGAPSPTATITLTPTKTPVPTSTLRFTQTPVPSATPVP